ncbi:MAG: DUF2807 domain-containing protein, partial [Calditrichaeota bacterium]|nr:DUF2807 domain-containing protein [Calditrichota bacterium]
DRVVENIRVDVHGGTLEVYSKSRRSWIGKFFHDNNDPEVKIIIMTKKLSEAEFNGTGSVEIEPLDQDDFDLTINGPIDSYISGDVKNLHITNNGPGDIEMDNMHGESLDIANRGPGDIKAGGKYTKTDITILGPGDFRARRFESDYLKARIVGPGNIEMQVNEEINARFIGPGNVSYTGNARIVNDSGIGPGRVRRM